MTSARGRTDAAYVGGLLSRGSGALLREARRRAPGGPLVLAAGYGPAAQLVTEAGPVADGAYLVVAGVPVERLGEAGRDFVTHFATAIGRSPHPYAVYAAQAASLLLDAIARSNGTRRSIARARPRDEGQRGIDRNLRVRRERRREARSGDDLPDPGRPHGDRAGPGFGDTLTA